MSEIILYRVPEACKILGIGRTLLYELMESGELRTVKVRGRRLIRRDEIIRFVESLGPPTE